MRLAGRNANVMTALAGWGNFYVIVGSSAGALIGLQFVVITLIADMPIAPVEPHAVHAFSTPSIVHFGAVLLLSAVQNVPWTGLNSVAVLWGLLGLSGGVYEVVVVRLLRVQTVYRLQFEDWLFHVLLPLAAYSTLAISAYAARSHLREALFGVGAAALVLLFIGIHNAWDNITYHVFARKQDEGRTEQTR
jgi:hypothetical protein